MAKHYQFDGFQLSAEQSRDGHSHASSSIEQVDVVPSGSEVSFRGPFETSKVRVEPEASDFLVRVDAINAFTKNKAQKVTGR